MNVSLNSYGYQAIRHNRKYFRFTIDDGGIAPKASLEGPIKAAPRFTDSKKPGRQSLPGSVAMFY
jgi:hypothetical protein